MKLLLKCFKKTDIYSLGVIFESMIRPKLYSLNDSARNFFYDLIKKMVCINPGERINIDEVIRILKNDTNKTFNIGGNLSLKNKTSQIFQGGKKKSKTKKNKW